MGISKNTFFKIIIIFIIVILPIIVLVLYSKEHTFIEQNKKLPKEYAQYFNSKYTILYIGYVGCRFICTPRLQEISKVQKRLNFKDKNIEFSFLDLRSLDNYITNDFLKAFDGKFKAMYLDEEKKKRFLRELNVYYTRALSDSLEFEHTSYLYVIKKVDNKINLVATIMQHPFNNEKTIKFLNKRLNIE